MIKWGWWIKPDIGGGVRYQITTWILVEAGYGCTSCVTVEWLDGPNLCEYKFGKWGCDHDSWSVGEMQTVLWSRKLSMDVNVNSPQWCNYYRTFIQVWLKWVLEINANNLWSNCKLWGKDVIQLGLIRIVGPPSGGSPHLKAEYQWKKKKKVLVASSSVGCIHVPVLPPSGFGEFTKFLTWYWVAKLTQYWHWCTNIWNI